MSHCHRKQDIGVYVTQYSLSYSGISMIDQFFVPLCVGVGRWMGGWWVGVHCQKFVF